MESLAIAPGFMLQADGATDVGQQRDHNEDVVLIRKDLGLFVLADGAGGHNAGEVAAELACKTIAEYMEQTAPEAAEQPEFDRFGIPNQARRLSIAVHQANRRVVELAQSSEKHRGMGTTIVATSYAKQHGMLHVAHAGDSRCYRLRHGHLEALTEDHSLMTDVLEQRPELDEKKLQRLPKNIVTRALGMGPTIRVSVRSHRVLGGDRYLLCSDGLSAVINPDQIVTLLDQAKPPATVVKHLISLANQCGAPDNVGVVVIAVDGQPSRELFAGRQRHAP
ncbi:MAG TPA: protein phosphatase 2C domain-containing protein, partial [Polyangiaceae bacterium]|nr:protein phosphatase 2C domain-containing protein [Polyangiaceae bacterium]